MYRPALLSVHRAQVVQGLPFYIEQAPQRFAPYGDCDWSAGINSFSTALNSIGRRKGEAAYPIVSYMLLYFQDQLAAVLRDFDSIIQGRQLIWRELYINHGTDYLGYSTFCHDILLVLNLRRCHVTAGDIQEFFGD